MQPPSLQPPSLQRAWAVGGCNAQRPVAPTKGPEGQPEEACTHWDPGGGRVRERGGEGEEKARSRGGCQPGTKADTDRNKEGEKIPSCYNLWFEEKCGLLPHNALE